MQAKLHEKLLDHLGQLFGEVRASRDVLRRKVLHKRRFGSISLSTEEQQALGKLKKVICTSAIPVFTIHYALLACHPFLLNISILFWSLSWQASLLAQAHENISSSPFWCAFCSQIPTAGILTNGMHYITFKYTEDPLELVQYRRLSLPSTMGTPNCKFQEVKVAMFIIVRHLMSLLSSQIKAAEVHLPESFFKRAKCSWHPGCSIYS